jgi:transketolase
MVKLNQEMKNIRRHCLAISYHGKDGNLPSVFSSLEIMHTLYNYIMNYNDDFVLSKGQASLGLYVILSKCGILNIEEIYSFGEFNSRFSMQVDRTKFNGEIKTSAGSLGHGLPMAVGMAMAKKIQGDTSNVYVLVGDGEFNTGTMWESLLIAKHHNLNNLCVIIDDNNSSKSMIDMGDMKLKFEAFGFSVAIANGHNHISLFNAITSHINPLVIIAKTKRGYGCKTLMNDKSWFHRFPNEDELIILDKEVDEFEETNV